MRATYLSAFLFLAGCASAEPAELEPKLRVGQLYSNGNCEIDADNKLTGLCHANGRKGCQSRAPASDSPQCVVGQAGGALRAPVCGGSSSGPVSRENECFFVE